MSDATSIDGPEASNGVPYDGGLLVSREMRDNIIAVGSS